MNIDSKLFCFVQIVNPNFDENQNFSRFVGDIIRGNAYGNITTKTLSFVIPQTALSMAQNINSNFTGQFSILHFEKNFFSSNLNVSEVSTYMI